MVLNDTVLNDMVLNELVLNDSEPRKTLSPYGLINISMTPSGILINLDELDIKFSCKPEIVMANDKIFSIEMDFVQPTATTNKSILILKNIEMFMMKSDCFFFMLYEFDYDKEILENPIHESIDLLTLQFRWKHRA